MNVIDLSQLPAPLVVESRDYETLLAEPKAAFIALYPLEEQNAVMQTLTLESEPIIVAKSSRAGDCPYQQPDSRGFLRNTASAT